MPTTDGRLRSVTEPTAERKSPLDQLGIRLPDRLNSNRECNVDSASYRFLSPLATNFSQGQPAHKTRLRYLSTSNQDHPGGQRSAGVLKNDPLFRAAALYRA